MTAAQEKKEQRLKLLDDHIGRSLAESEARGELKAAPSYGKPLNLGDGDLPPSLWLVSALGARGLSLAVLCAELLAARVHQEPLPIEVALAQAINIDRKNRLKSPSNIDN